MRKKLARYKSPEKLLKSEGYGRRTKKQMSRARHSLRQADILYAGRHDWAMHLYLNRKRDVEVTDLLRASGFTIYKKETVRQTTPLATT